MFVAFKLSPKEGEFLVKLARKAVEEYLEKGTVIDVPKDVPAKLMERCGVFVTLNRVEGKKKALRGCIGLPYPDTPLAQAVVEAAISSATQDPRFPLVSLEDLSHIVFELSVLTPPKLVEVDKPQDYPAKVKVGRDGLIVESGYCKGLLLPQVPVEWKWNAEEFLSQCCVKAGLMPDYWLVKGTKVYQFSCIIAQETSPRGPVVIKDMRCS